jgi:pilus assembly protein Flp/PilA
MEVSIYLYVFIDHSRMGAMWEFGFRKAQGLTEYALIIMLVAMIVIILLWILGAPLGNMFSNVIHNM